MLPDPAMTSLAATTVALVLAAGAWQKLRDPLAFELAVEAYELLPAALVRPLARLLPLLEGAGAVLLVIGPTRAVGAALALAVLALVTGAVAVNLLRGRTDVGCGCGGLEDEQPLSWVLVARNALLAGLALAAAGTAAPRSLAGLDYLTIAAGALALYGIYVVANQLIANAPRLARLRRAA